MPGRITPDARRLRFAVLGPLRVRFGDAELDVGPVRQQAVLAALALRPDVTTSQAELLDRVWGLEPPGSGVKNMPGYVFRLRRCLQSAGVDAKSVIVSDRSGYRFVGGAARLDTMDLDGFAAEAGEARRAGDLAAAIDAHTAALALFEGEPLAGLPGPFAVGERRRLTERRIALLQDKLDAQIRSGRYDEAIDELSVWIEAYPHTEPLAALLVRARYGGGRPANALKVLPELRERLVRDLGVEPGDEVQRAHQAVLRGDDAALGITPRRDPVRRTPVAGPTGRPRDELPVDVGEVVGRDRELSLLTGPLDDSAVTTAAVDGVAGAGKTALAVNAARVLRARSPDGCLFVDLHGHSGRTAPAPQRVLRRLLRSVGVDDSGIPDDVDELAASWRAASASLRLVLVLDDASGAEQVRPLLPAGAGSCVLVTSRRRLAGLDVDRRVTLGALDLDAAQVLLDRVVGASRSGREQDAVRRLAQLCGRLPLALCIAGARLQTRPEWTFGDLTARLVDDESRLGGLSAGDRSVEAAFETSYGQLPAGDRRAFRMLGVSPAPEVDRLALAAMLGCSAAEAERALENLVDASLLQQPAAGRYRLHDLVAVYARRLAAGERPEMFARATRGVYRLYTAAGRLASEWGAASYPTGPDLGAVPFRGRADATAWLDRAGDLADVVAHAAAAGHVDEACWMAEGLADYLVRRRRAHECRAAVEVALSRVEEATDARMRPSLRFCLGFAQGMQGRYRQAYASFTAALEHSRRGGDRREEVRARGALVVIDTMAGRHTGAVADLTEAARAARELGNDWAVERAMSSLGYVHLVQGRLAEALSCFSESHAVGEKIGSPAMVGRSLGHVGSVQLQLGRPADAAATLRRAVELGEQVADVLLHAGSLTRLGAAEQELGDLDTALDLHRRALDLVSGKAVAELEQEIRGRLGHCCLAMGRHAEAREHLERARALSAMPPQAEEGSVHRTILLAGGRLPASATV
ncbi:AfsR/SARP family transcriptional regulator [Pseudonocardia kunmingensis]|uniref:DNA-binding SARP family transcriptional activator n=1 Tax=Pseudonocardia kunmingensis TaxID=630975 RepID=A0A543D969_9PSEU|nr:BTAD domain-containing putative transcriptional regulator [Pseudonocardia kunmingensis]TQM05891.1 DNA-binding SARP family transcriptional activator [Pseudonocardia kunmingensis]